ncbi:hypothetical protein HYW41_01920 [Candidatus Daviesbacteria bacterium]|nr:hypothetical protein [Candidatus Daviesbacteria bacterium]
MKKNKLFISLKPFSGQTFLKNKIFKLDNGTNIFLNFKKCLEKYNIDISTIDLSEGKSIYRYVYCDIPYPWEIGYWKKIIQNKEKNILFCFESPIINPFNQLRFLSIFFKRIYTWNDHLVDNKKYFKFHIPQLNSKKTTNPLPFNNKDFLVLINSNKMVPFLLKLISPFKQDFYIEREKAIEFFEDHISKNFSLYGKGWDKPKRLSLKEKIFGFNKHNSYKGEIKDKLKLLSKFKFTICFENCPAPGYIEKIFDCFKAGCIPIYFGAPNITDYIDEKCFINFRKFSSYGKLLNFLYKIDEKTYNRYIENIENLLSNKNFLNLWFEKGFEKVFLDGIS